MANNESTEILQHNDLKTLPEKLLQEDPNDTTKYLPRLIWPRTTNFPTFDAFYLHTNGEIYSLQMTVAQKDDCLQHSLNNSGAYQAKAYLDKIATKVAHRRKATGTAAPAAGYAKCKAIFVTPKDRCRFKKQKFTGNVKLDGNIIKEKDAAAEMDKLFDQFIVHLD